MPGVKKAKHLKNFTKAKKDAYNRGEYDISLSHLMWPELRETTEAMKEE